MISASGSNAGRVFAPSRLSEHGQDATLSARETVTQIVRPGSDQLDLVAEASLSLSMDSATSDNAITVDGDALSRVRAVLLREPCGDCYGVDTDSSLLTRPVQRATHIVPLRILGDCDEPYSTSPRRPVTRTDDGSTRQVASVDPNDIVGPAGFGPEQFLPADAPLFYTIRFENLAAATAAAQTVVVTQTLDTDLDLSTFELVSFGLGGSVVELPDGRDFFSARFDQSASHGVLLDVSADLNRVTGLLTWRFTSLDPTTFDQPQDPFAGFLPPNQTSPQGEGFVSYFVRPKAGLSTGTRLDAQARIVFDTNAPIDTPAIFNTIDAGAPSSAVNALPAVIGTPSFVVGWAGQDDAGGSGIATFDIYVATDGGDFVRWLDDTTNTQATFTGEIGRTLCLLQRRDGSGGTCRVVACDCRHHDDHRRLRSGGSPRRFPGHRERNIGRTCQ